MVCLWESAVNVVDNCETVGKLSHSKMLQLAYICTVDILPDMSILLCLHTSTCDSGGTMHRVE